MEHHLSLARLSASLAVRQLQAAADEASPGSRLHQDLVAAAHHIESTMHALRSAQMSPSQRRLELVGGTASGAVD